MFDEIERKLRCLQSDSQVAELVDLLTQTVGSEKKLTQLVCESSKLGGIYLVKFIVLFSKKNQTFFKSIEPHVPNVVLFCYQQTQSNVIVLLVEGWRMMGPVWAKLADKSLLLLKLYSSREQLVNVLTYEPIDEEPTTEQLEMRMDKIIQTLNVLTQL